MTCELNSTSEEGQYFNSVRQLLRISRNVGTRDQQHEGPHDAQLIDELAGKSTGNNHREPKWLWPLSPDRVIHWQ
jgi:hypothetical protein